MLFIVPMLFPVLLPFLLSMNWGSWLLSELINATGSASLGKEKGTQRSTLMLLCA